MSAKSIGAVAATLAILSGVAWWVLREVEHAESEGTSIAGEVGSASRERSAAEEQANTGLEHVARAEDAAPRAADPVSTAGTPAAPRDLFVRVVDAAGRALPDFPLALEFSYPDGAIYPGVTFETPFTDGSGQYVLADAAERCAARWEQHARSPRPLRPGERAEAPTFAATTWSVRAAAIALMQPHASFDPRALPAEPLVLAVPCTGSLRVCFTGSFPAAGLALDVRAVPGTTPEHERRWNAQPTSPFTTGEPEVHWPYVALDQLVRITATPLDGSAPPSTAEVFGPRTEGETAVGVVALEEPFPAIVGKLLAENGAPLARTNLHARVRKQSEGRLFKVGGIAVFDPPEAPRGIGTDASGGFRVPIDGLVALEGDSWLQLEVLSGAEVPEAAIGAVAEWLLPRPLSAGVHDAGVLFARPKPLLAAGHVRGAHGEALAGVRIVPSRPMADALGQTTTWFALDSLATTSDERGHFELRGILEADQLRLAAHKSGFAALEEPEVARGTADVSIRLAPGACIRGRVQFPAGLTWFELEVALHRGRKQLERRKLERDGGFAFEDLSPASCDVRIWTDQGNRLLHSIEDVQPWTGPGTGGDPRLASIDLARDWRGVPLRVLDRGRHPFFETYLHVSPLAADADAFWAQTASDGRIALVIPAAAQRLYLSAGGHAGVEIDCRDVEQEVALDAAIPVRLELDAAGYAALRAERLALVLEYDPLPSGRITPARISPFAEAAEPSSARAELPLPGRYRVRWMRRTSSGPVHALQIAAEVEPVFVEIAGGRGEQSVRVETPAVLLKEK